MTVKVQVLANDHQQHNHTEEACSPFCTCSCCAASAFYAATPKTTATKVFIQTDKYPLYSVAFNTEVYYAIWQPPKLAA